MMKYHSSTFLRDGTCWHNGEADTLAEAQRLPRPVADAVHTTITRWDDDGGYQGSWVYVESDSSWVDPGWTYWPPPNKDTER